MSALSVRRLKERSGGGGGGTVKATAPKFTRSITPVTERSITGGDSLKRTTGKENPRPTSRTRAAGALKPVIRPMPRIDKSVASTEARLRWSTTSVPRGRSSSPCEFNRDVSDLRKTRVSAEKASSLSGLRCANGVQGTVYAKSNEKCEIGIRGLKESKGLGRNDVSSGESRDLYKDLGSKDCKRSGSGSCDSGSRLGSSRVLDGGREESRGRASVRVRCSEVGDKSGSGGNVGAKGLGRNSVDRLSGSEVLKGKVVVCDGGSGSGSTAKKYQSKLHEKLAFLEGKVKRIASDIKRTKEILDLNNPDASKLILTDIHEKISGIEKVMGHVVDGADTQIGVADHSGGDSKKNGNGEKSQKDVGSHMKSLVKGLNTEELEERLFPHHKLIRDRTSLKTSVGGLQSSSQGHDPSFVGNTDESTIELEKQFSAIDENPVALEFLGSLKEEQLLATTRGENVGVEYCGVQETDGDVDSAAQDSLDINNRDESTELVLTTSETLEDFDDQENRPSIVIEEESDDSCLYQLNEIGYKTTTGGWFVSEGESVLLTHDDGSCSFYDIANCEVCKIAK